MTISFNGSALALDAADFTRTATSLNVDVAAVKAVVSVETNGQGFDPQDRPKMLFEPHIFYRLLTGDKRQAAVEQGLAYARWGEKPYPKDSYSRLTKAMRIDEGLALQACSWGLGQILGTNFHMVAPTIQDMVAAACESGGKQLDQMAAYIKADGLEGALRSHNWVAFALKYNGPTERRNGYDKKLAAAYKKQPRGAPRVVADHPLSQYDIKALQQQLDDLGYHEVGVIDGKWGSRTIAALSAFQHEAGLPTTGVYDGATKAALATAPPRPLSVERTSALTVDGSRTIQTASVLKGSGAAVAGVSALSSLMDSDTMSAILDKGEQAQTLLTRTHNLLEPMVPAYQFLAAHPFWFVGVIAFAMMFGGHLIHAWKLDDFRKGQMA